jgi:hypothetical protein
MNLLSLVGPRLDNIYQIRRKCYYLSGYNFLQSKHGPDRRWQPLQELEACCLAVVENSRYDDRRAEVLKLERRYGAPHAPALPMVMISSSLSCCMLARAVLLLLQLLTSLLLLFISFIRVQPHWICSAGLILALTDLYG